MVYDQSVDAYLAKFNNDGKRIWATYYGGEWSDRGKGCAVDDNNNVYLTGLTGSRRNISYNGHKNYLSPGASVCAFLVKFNSNANQE